MTSHFKFEFLSQHSSTEAFDMAHTKLTLALADSLANAAIKTAKHRKFAPVSVVVIDSSGNIIVSKRMDGCSPVGIPQFALAKAKTCVAMRMSSREFRDRYTKSNDPQKYCQMLSMVQITDGGMAPFPGGLPIKAHFESASSHKSEVIGAIGISGAAGDEDEECALSALEHEGFQI
jgi:uncharacterized protein GlcG (DUF336 family)